MYLMHVSMCVIAVGDSLHIVYAYPLLYEVG
jgi:hypothetical protein